MLAAGRAPRLDPVRNQRPAPRYPERPGPCRCVYGNRPSTSNSKVMLEPCQRGSSHYYLASRFACNALVVACSSGDDARHSSDTWLPTRMLHEWLPNSDRDFSATRDPARRGARATYATIGSAGTGLRVPVSADGRIACCSFPMISLPFVDRGRSETLLFACGDCASEPVRRTPYMAGHAGVHMVMAHVGQDRSGAQRFWPHCSSCRDQAQCCGGPSSVMSQAELRKVRQA
jgi:hypothetical protein